MQRCWNERHPGSPDSVSELVLGLIRRSRTRGGRGVEFSKPVLKLDHRWELQLDRGTGGRHSASPGCSTFMTLKKKVGALLVSDIRRF